jgi:UDP-N-acetylmuramate dehydrogenase
VGAYGQEVADTVTAVEVLDRTDGHVRALDPAACRFRYRDSVFRRDTPGRFVILGVTFRLRPGGPPTVRYEELRRHLAAAGRAAPTLGDVRTAVLAIRRTKSMVLDPADPNRRSCGSFFLNPVLPAETAARVAAQAGDPGMPRWPEPDGRVKLSAAWCLEQAGFRRGDRAGPVGLSTHHVLAVVAHEGARAADVVGFARRLRDAVEARLGVRLVPEPVFWGFPGSTDGALPP